MNFSSTLNKPPFIKLVFVFAIGLGLATTTLAQIKDRNPDAKQAELDNEYLKKWTPIRRMDSRFPYENESDDDWVDDRFQKMDTGPTFCGSIKAPTVKGDKGMTPKAIAIRIGNDPKRPAAVLFDTERLYIRAAWSGDFLTLPPKRFGMLEMPSIKGQIEFTSDWDVSWNWQDENDKTILADSTNSRFEKYILHENRVQLNYQIDGTKVVEFNSLQPPRPQNETILLGFAHQLGPLSYQGSNQQQAVTQSKSKPHPHPIFRRTLIVEKNKTKKLLTLINQKAESFRWLDESNRKIGMLTFGESSWVIQIDQDSSARLLHKQNTNGRQRVSLEVPESDSRQTINIHTTRCKTGMQKQLLATFTSEVPHRSNPRAKEPQRFNPSTKPRWGKPIVTNGKRAIDDKPLVVDEITVPYENPYQALMYTSGVDFLPDGTAFVCTMHGDVWRVTGIDDDLDEITWQRFATGLYQPLGLKIVGETIHVLGRDRITILNDLNDDGEADEYVNFCDLLKVNGQPHAYAMSLETDSKGNFYFIKSGGSAPHGGTMVKVSPDGKTMDVFATGYRHANGMGVGPNDEVTSADNEGHWVPTTRIDLVQQGGFYGHMPTHRRETKPESYDKPLCWVPRLIDSSAGGQVWVNSKRWGALDGKLLHLSFGRATANVVLSEMVDGTHQAGIYKLELPTFLSGVMRGRFHTDGHLYATGLDGWQTAAVKDGCLQRVRATGKPIYVPTDLHVKKSGIEITFSQPVDAEDAGEVDHWDVQQWKYRWSKKYGSDHYRISNPEEIGHDEVKITNISVSADGKTVTLKLDDLKPVMQMQITGKIRAKDGTIMPVQIFNTIHTIGD